MTLQIKKVNNQIYIVDVDTEIKEGDLVYFISTKEIVIVPEGGFKGIKIANILIATHEQIDIDNLWEKYLEALAEKLKVGVEIDNVNIREVVIYQKAFKEGYLQAKKETPFSLEDLENAFECGSAYTIGSHEDFKQIHPDFKTFIQQLKVSKIPECSVEIEMENYGICEICNKQGLLHCARPEECNSSNTYSRPKLTNNKVTITKLIL